MDALSISHNTEDLSFLTEDLLPANDDSLPSLKYDLYNCHRELDSESDSEISDQEFVDALHAVGIKNKINVCLSN